MGVSHTPRMQMKEACSENIDTFENSINSADWLVPIKAHR